MLEPLNTYLNELRGVVRTLRPHPELFRPSDTDENPVLMGSYPTLTLGEKLIRFENRWFGNQCGERSPQEVEGRHRCSLELYHEGPHQCNDGLRWVYHPKLLS